MGIFEGILEKVKLDIDVSEIINEVSNDDKKMTIKNELSRIVLDALVSIQEVKAGVINTEHKGNFIQRTWRPIVILALVTVVLCKWYGLTDSTIPVELELELMGMIKLGLGGYIGGRTVEKVADTVTKNIDLSFLKKKFRKNDNIK
jgi:hypothetical protein